MYAARKASYYLFFFEVVMNKSFASRIRIFVLAISLPLAIATAPAVPFNASAAVAQGATSIDNLSPNESAMRSLRFRRPVSSEWGQTL